MSFGQDLKDMFDVLTKGSHYIEVELFTKLQDALLLLEKRYGPYGIKLIHGERSKVTFTVCEDWVSGAKASVKKRELADMFFIVLSPSAKKIRCFFLQNKSCRNFLTSRSTHYFYADLIQLDLLKNRSEFKYNEKECSILSSAKLSSIASYGVFYHDGNFNYDMAYIPGDKIKPVNTFGKALIRSVKCKALWNKVVSINGNSQLDGCETMIKFADGMINMNIGEPICSLKTVGYICGKEVEKKCRELLDDKDENAWDEIDSNNLDEILMERFGQCNGTAVKTIVIINADTIRNETDTNKVNLKKNWLF